MTFEDQFSPKDHAVLKKMGILLSRNQITLANPSKSKGTEEQAKITEIKEIQLVKTNERRFNFWSIITVFSLQHRIMYNPSEGESVWRLSVVHKSVELWSLHLTNLDLITSNKVLKKLNSILFAEPTR